MPSWLAWDGGESLLMPHNENLAVSSSSVTRTHQGQAHSATARIRAEACHLSLPPLLFPPCLVQHHHTVKVTPLACPDLSPLELCVSPAPASFLRDTRCSLLMCPLLQLALDYGIKFMETSAKANINVENVSPRLLGDTGLWDQCCGALGAFLWEVQPGGYRGTGLWLSGPSPVLLMGPLQRPLLGTLDTCHWLSTDEGRVMLHSSQPGLRPSCICLSHTANSQPQ